MKCKNFDKKSKQKSCFLLLLISLVLCACSNTKLYTEKEIVNYLKARYNVEFIILEKYEITRDEIEYKVALKDNESITFTIINELAVTGSDIGPKKNFINCKEITDYFEKREKINEKSIQTKENN